MYRNKYSDCAGAETPRNKYTRGHTEAHRATRLHHHKLVVEAHITSANDYSSETAMRSRLSASPFAFHHLGAAGS
jgi:hypothetical protein